MTQKASLLVERARTLAPLLGQHSEEAERLRRPHDAVIEALEESELFKLMVPRALGGFELDLDTFLEVGLALGEGDASMAWVANFYIEHCWMFCHFPQEFQKTVFGDRGYTLAPASIAPTGRATPVDGGFRLKGRWQWGTGVMHAHWVLLSAIVESPDNALDVRLFALPIADVAVEDVWYVDGMQGTGSNDIVVHDVLVPTDRTTAMADMLVGRSAASKLYPGPLYRTPTAAILALAAAMPSVGQARAAVRRLRDHVAERILYASSTRQSEMPAAQIRLARADIEARQAEELLRRTVAEVMALRDRASAEDRARWLAAYAFAVDQSKRVLLSIAEASGAHAHFQSHPLQRAVRDVNTMACHVVFDLDARMENYGRTLLGMDPIGPF